MRHTFHPRWEAMAQTERLDAIAKHVGTITATGQYPTGALFNSTKPDWMPTTNAIRNNIFLDWTALMSALGIQPLEWHYKRKDIEILCECGNPIQTVRPIQVCIGGKYPTQALMPLCNDCAQLWDEDNEDS